MTSVVPGGGAVERSTAARRRGGGAWWGGGAGGAGGGGGAAGKRGEAGPAVGPRAAWGGGGGGAASQRGDGSSERMASRPRRVPGRREESQRSQAGRMRPGEVVQRESSWTRGIARRRAQAKLPKKPRPLAVRARACGTRRTEGQVARTAKCGA